MPRTKNAVRNIIFGVVNKIVILLGTFIIRTIMINELGSEYLGLSSLFTSILQVLNLTELGFSSAVIYSMYKAIAQKDTDTICALLNLYKKIYRIIGLIILGVGLTITPFITNFINGTYPNDINIYILYIMYLVNTAITYFLFAYKSALLTAHQRNDVVSNINTIAFLIQYVVQAVILIVFKNYYIFLIIAIVSSVLNNIICAIGAKKMYPEYIAKGELQKETKEDIKTKVKGLMITRICQTTRNSFDSIFISAFLGLTMVTMYQNYYIVMGAVLVILGIISNAVVASVRK